MKLTVLGSGSPEAYLRRASSGYLIETGEDVILFDCGGGVVDSLLRAGHKPSDITHLFFTHLHTDHMMDYARLVHAAWDEGGAPLKVFGPAPIAAITEGYFGASGVLAHDLRARTELPQSQEVWRARGGTLPRPWPAPQMTEITAGYCFEGKGWHLQSCLATHAQPLLDCMAFRLDAKARSFVYSGDTGITAELEQMARGADLLLHWCYRLDGEAAHPSMVAMTPTPSEIGALAARADVGALWLTHFRVHMDGPGKHAAALAAAGAAFGGDVVIAEDLMEHSF